MAAAAPDMASVEPYPVTGGDDDLASRSARYRPEVGVQHPSAFKQAKSGLLSGMHSHLALRSMQFHAE